MKVEPQILTVTRRKGRSAQISRSHNHQQLVNCDGKTTERFESVGKNKPRSIQKKIRFSLQTKENFQCLKGYIHEQWMQQYTVS